jgi:hypothetical protein
MPYYEKKEDAEAAVRKNKLVTEAKRKEVFCPVARRGCTLKCEFWQEGSFRQIAKSGSLQYFIRPGECTYQRR